MTQRRGLSLWGAIWILALAMGAILFARDLAMVRWGGDLSIMGAALWGRDFVNVYTSGALTLQGRLDILYDVQAYRAFQDALFAPELAYHNYSYPPVTLVYTWLFALIPYPVALVAWLGGTGYAFVRAARPYLGEAGVPAWLALAAPASLVNLWAGHYGFLIGALWLGAFHILPRRPWLAGILIGCMIVKPHLAVLAPLVLLHRREWRAILAAAATSVGLVLLSIILFGPELWTTYLGRTAMLQAAMVDDLGTFFIQMMPTLMPSLALIGVPTFAAGVIQGLLAAAVAGLLWWRMPDDSKAAGLAAATATFLVLPYAFSYDMTVAGLAGLLLFRTRGDALSAVAFLLPLLLLILNAIPAPLAPLVIGFQLWALLFPKTGLRRA